MSIAWRELRRRPGRFAPALVAITLLVVLLVVLGGFLDGLVDNTTGALRAQGDRLLVVSSDSETTPSRSTLTDDQLSALGSSEAAAAVGTFSQATTTAGIAGGDRGFDDLSDVVLVGYDLATDVLPEPPADGAVVDALLSELLDVEVGDTLAIGPQELELEVTALVDDVTAGSPSVWVDSEAWRELSASVDPTSRPTVQAGVVELADEVDRGDLEGTLGDGLEVATVDEVIAANDVVTQQASTFQGIIGVTFVVTLLVVALFFVLLTIERIRLYAVLKAVGGRSRDLLSGLALQAVVVAVAAVAIGFGLALVLLALVPPDLPIVLVPSRLATIAVTTVVVAVLGALATLRRVLAVDPADAIG